MTPESERRVWMLALGGGLMLFFVQPPADLWPLAWLAPLPWLALVLPAELPGRRPWLAIWCGGFLHWLLAIHWLRLPHPATSIGWVLLSAYLACYPPLFVASARRLVHRWRWPLVPAAAAAWMGCEQLRGQFLGGFTFAGLGHTQWRWTALIQCADSLGAVGVSGVVMAGAAGLAAIGLRHTAARRPLPIHELVMAVAVVAAAAGYGVWRLAEGLPAGDVEPLDVLLVQGSIDTELKHDPAATVEVARHYDELTMQGLAADAKRRPDIVVWPETMWRVGLLDVDPHVEFATAEIDAALGPAVGSGDAPAARQARYRDFLVRQRLDALAPFAARYATTWLVGLDRQRLLSADPPRWESFNSALFLDAAGRALAVYDKMHPVMFGEFIPFADRLPFLYRLSPLPGGLTAGRAPVAVDLAGHRVAVNICYETALPDAVRGLVRTLAAEGRKPDVIVNLTNDGWFWGSSELDMHLVAAIFRAVEVRTPIVIAANTGFSASIDGSGRLLACGPRRATAALRVAVRPDGRFSPWLVWGSLPATACVGIVAIVLGEGAWAARDRRSSWRTGGAARTPLEPG